ncbi:rho GTPase-activating protein 12-like isoform X4 [Zootermopsis nevadensis]|uniref:rho GTPase-activating protein 12-like isoform X4 n=1 Tax=Zootermopsis nevadensis TaxID=136037 RepID=UPI000B8E96C6|nr:rho GTPase-activating protein 12-like isoform X4 [Zootermopsis nevadensis]
MSEDFSDIQLRVLYDFEYVGKDERKIRIQEGEKLFLIKKTNADWWQVIRSSSERPFFVPAAYVREYSWSQDTSEELSHHGSISRQQKNDLKASYTSTDVKNNSSNFLEYDKRTDVMSVSCPGEHQIYEVHCEKQPDTFQNVKKKSSNVEGFSKEETNHILLDKRKSWAVEELVAELSKMRTERNHHEPPNVNLEEDKHRSKDRISSSSSHMNHNTIHSSPDDKILFSSKHALSLENDKADNTAQRNKGGTEVRSCISVSEPCSEVRPIPLEGLKHVGKVKHKLSESLEKLAQEIRFQTVAAVSSENAQSNTSSSFNEPSIVVSSAVDNKKMESAFSRIKSKLSYSNSFKTRKEMQQVLKHRSGNSVLSTSWENALSECKKTEDYKVIQDEKKLNSGHVSSSFKGQVDLDHCQLKASHSGSDLEVLNQVIVSQKASNQHWNLVRHHVFNDKVKGIQFVSGSESEENLDESVCRDEGSVSGLSDDILCQRGTNKGSSDISDGAVSDDLLVIESLSKGGEEKEGDPCSSVKLQRKLVSLSRKSRETVEDGSVENLRSDTSSPLVEVNGSSGTTYIPVPPGWSEAYDEDSFQVCYINNATGVKWFSSNDAEGKVYFFEENSNQSSWTLPDFGNAGSDNPAHSASRNPSELERQTKKDEHCHDTDVHLRSGQQVCQPEIRAQQRMTKAHSMVLANSSRKKQTSSKSSSFPRNWPQLWDGNMCVLKEGTLNRTKITENGKKLRKNWAPAHVVLTELFLLFFKDAKTFEAMKNSNEENASGAAQPEFSIDLNGALLEHGEKVSSRRNVFLLTTVLGLQVLLQCENAQQEEEWYKAIFKAIKDLPYAYDVSPRNKASKLNPVHISSGSPEEIKKSSVIGRSRSMKMKLTSKDESQEDLTAGSEENQTKIRNRLKKFFHRRPTKESLVKKGIYKDEPVFGRNLQDVCKGESPRVPVFVRRCIAAIECKEENMKTDGLYRASGNLSQVQKIRLQVDQNNLDVLDQEEDVHVLTGALKLFFRELKKPLIPFEHFSKALRASTNPSKKEKLQHFKEIVKALPLQNRDTLEFLFRHLLRVTAYKEFNRMHIPNLAIVFGPTLMWPEAESLNMALDLMQQNLVIEYLLQEFDSLFH